MNRRRLAATLAVVAVMGLVPAGSMAAQPRIGVAVDRTLVTTRLGHTFVIRSRIANRAPVPAREFIAHLNVLSLDGKTYVDPEDWSSHRTRYLEPIPARGSTTLTWKLDAVNAGEIGVYVAVLPREGAGLQPATGPLVRVTIPSRKTLNAGGILPLVLGVPALVGVFAAALSLARRRHLPSRRPAESRGA